MPGKLTGVQSKPKGKNAGPRPIGQLLTELTAKYGWGQKRRDGDLREAWSQAVGPDIAALTRVVGIRGGKLEVIVASSVWIQELTFQRDQILGNLRKSPSGAKIRDLRFRVGVVTEQ